jgi:hypothetical protein
MSQKVLHTPAWLLLGLTGSEEGTLELANGRFTFTSIDGQRVFDVALAEVREVKFPWYYFGGGMKLSIGTERYRVSFMQPGNTAGGGGLEDIAPGREIGKQWRAALTSRV